MATINPNAPTTGTMLHANPEQIEVMELDLAEKAKAALEAAGFTQNEIAVYGVFSLDDLETKSASEMCMGVTVGVGYLEATTLSATPANTNPSQSAGQQTLALRFMILVMVPPAQDCAGRYNGTKLLALLRQYILGSAVSGDERSKTWAFVRERPETEQSSQQMLIFSQVWQLVLPQIGRPAR